MRTAYILLLCILGAALLSTVLCQSGNGLGDCCFIFYPRTVRKEYIKSYSMTDQQCPKNGVIFVTKKSRHICVDPSLKWAQRIMTILDEELL
ncbi:C-C motif chemokine 18-like isoform 1-T1 [Pholidichthys leucotaenia]